MTTLAVRMLGELGFDEGLDGFLLEVFRGDEGGSGVDDWLNGFAFEFGDGGFDAEVSHVDGVLEDGSVHFAFFEGVEEGGVAIEADEFDFAGEVFGAECLEHAVSAGLVAAEDAVDCEGVAFGEAGDEVGGGVLGLGGGGTCELFGADDFDIRVFRDFLEESGFALFGGGAALHVAEDGDAAFAAEDFGDAACGDASAFGVVGGDEAGDEGFAFGEAGVDDDDGFSAIGDFFGGVAEGDGIEWGEDDGVVLEGLIADEVDLLGAVVLALWADEGDLDVEFLGGFECACLDGFPIDVGGAFGDDGDAGF